ncbi:zinc ribbon domain-containing protein [Sulfuracidifex metallicus]|uniref:Transposase n=1 Tax=Sulfuracidifex metallicus DSM 6482 = JCM 9184 TaxID=523847 RepID=A0A6A9QUT5_SULME|nr:zinc ribbon domain-containing protein [Sulfuracidifex metallicus]MUN28852.1 transposase [Sulfuracidifex metallicus DSM 6482 = JCM 9184]WOE50635.1 transposase [Sulfuracidifex metallicus DSM 6482 = JCM 9184]
MKEQLVSVKVIDFGKLKTIYDDICFFRAYNNAIRKVEGSRLSPPPSIPREILSSIQGKGPIRLGPIEIQFINETKIRLKGYNTLVEGVPELGEPLYAIVDMTDGIKVMLAYEGRKVVVGIDVGIRHLITVASLLDGKLWKVRYFGTDLMKDDFARYLGDNQGYSHLQTIRDKVRRQTIEAVNFIEEMNPKVVAMEDLRLYDNKIGRGLKTIQNALELELYKRGIRYRRLEPYNTSKICSNCGYKKGEILGSIFVCPACGYKADRDFNAAFNIALRCFYTC